MCTALLLLLLVAASSARRPAVIQDASSDFALPTNDTVRLRIFVQSNGTDGVNLTCQGPPFVDVMFQYGSCQPSLLPPSATRDALTNPPEPPFFTVTNGVDTFQLQGYTASSCAPFSSVPSSAFAPGVARPFLGLAGPSPTARPYCWDLTRASSCHSGGGSNPPLAATAATAAPPQLPTYAGVRTRVFAGYGQGDLQYGNYTCTGPTVLDIVFPLGSCQPVPLSLGSGIRNITIDNRGPGQGFVLTPYNGSCQGAASQKPLRWVFGQAVPQDGHCILVDRAGCQDSQ